MTTNRVSVECLECGKRFKTASLVPSCPKCGGSDIDVAAMMERPTAAERIRTTAALVEVLHGLGARGDRSAMDTA